MATTTSLAAPAEATLTVASPTAASPTDAPPIEPPLWPISVAMFTNMIDAGLIGENEPVYLWKGRLARRMPPKRPHSIAVYQASAALRAILPAGYSIEQEQPMALRFEPTAPQPDIRVLRGTPADYRPDLPTSADVPLILEVADSSLRLDRVMADTYSGEGIPVYVLVNLVDKCIEVFGDPQPATQAEGARYGTVATFGIEDSFPVVIDGVEVGRIAVRAILG